MKQILLLQAWCLIILTSVAQQGEWTWIHGDSAPNQNGNFGTQGVSSPANKPPAVYEGCEWTDRNGIFWLYGGQHTAGNFYSDLWKYDPAINEWVWVKGSGLLNQVAVYGTQGVPSPTNSPGGRGWAPSSWVDQNNNLWLFGGCNQSTADMNDLWMYNIVANEWTWMKGASFSGSPGNPGTMGVPSATNEPSARHESTCSWIDPSGDLWFFGGFGFGQTDDLWRYSIATNMWTWIKGDPLNANPPVFGTMGVPDPANTPGARNSYSRWADNSGNLWLFGGVFYSAGTYSDVWKYSIASNEWTWMKGPSITDDAGYYGQLCVEDNLNNPPSHNENRSCWRDSCGNLWMFGGVLATGTYPAKNDLWRYSPVTNNWTWVNGSVGINDPGSYGSLGVSSPANLPPSRMGSFAWQDGNGNLYMGFGQTPNNNNYRNDLWRYVPDPACGACSLIPVALFSAPNHICPGTCTQFINLSQMATSYLWTFPGATPSTSTDANPTGICYNSPGTYAVTLIASNSLTSDTLTLNNYITVYPYPAPQGINQIGDTLFANPGAVSYQWYQDGVQIPGATDYYYVATISGNYNVVATDGNGCEVEAAIFDVIAGIGQPGDPAFIPVRIYPSVVRNVVTMDVLVAGPISVSIVNSIGEIVYKHGYDGGRKSGYSIDVSGLPAGMYWVEVGYSVQGQGSTERVYRTGLVKQ